MQLCDVKDGYNQVTGVSANDHKYDALSYVLCGGFGPYTLVLGRAITFTRSYEGGKGDLTFYNHESRVNGDFLV